MSEGTTRENWLVQEVAAGRVDTVALSFADRLGGWRGKRVPASDFVERGSAALGFCDGMIVCDIQCGVIEETPFTNYSTGYPDLHVTFDARDARPMGWHPREAYVFGVPCDHGGAALSVAPMTVLASVVHRLATQGIEVSVAAELSGAFFDRDNAPVVSNLADWSQNLPWLLLNAVHESWIPVAYCTPGFDPGSFALGLERNAPLELAQSIVVAKGAAKELARLRGFDAIFMTRRPKAAQPALLQFDVVVRSGSSADAGLVNRLLDEVKPMLFPSINAMRQRGAPAYSSTSDGGTRWIVSASAEADAATALAAALSAIGVAMEGGEATGHVIDDLARARALLSCLWAVDWLGAPFIENSVPLFEYEASLFADSVTDWEIARYWGTA
jgi:glutamine synthetase